MNAIKSYTVAVANFGSGISSNYSKEEILISLNIQKVKKKIGKAFHFIAWENFSPKKTQWKLYSW